MPQGHLPNLGDHIACPIRGARKQERECLENPPVIRKGGHDVPSVLRKANSEQEWNFPTGARPHSPDHDGASHPSAAHSHVPFLLPPGLTSPFWPQTFAFQRLQDGHTGRAPPKQCECESEF